MRILIAEDAVLLRAGLIHLLIDAGDEVVAGGDDTTISIDGTLSRGLRSPSHSERLNGDKLVVHASCASTFNTFCGLDYRIRVPEGVSVRARVSDGSVTVTNVHGDLDISSSDGSVRFDGGGAGSVNGILRLHSTDGSVTASNLTSTSVDASTADGSIRLGFTAAPQAVSARSSDGSVIVEVPNDAQTYRVQASSSDGSAHTSIRVDPSSSRVIAARSSDGNVTIRYPSAG